MSLKIQVKIVNSMGLHTRPATHIVKLLQNYKSHVWFTYKRETVNARSILGILMLAARKNTKITIAVEGVDASETLQSLVDAFANGFGEKNERIA